MEDIMTMDLGADLLPDILFSESFVRFCSDIKAVDDMLEDHEFFLEKVDDQNLTFKKSLGGALANTADTTSNALAAHSNITTANATVIKSAWDLVMQAVMFTTRIVRFISTKIADLPRYVASIFRKIARIPPNIKNKITGNISLYIPASDLEALYNTNLFSRIDQYMVMAETLARGDFWGNWLFKKRPDPAGKQNDLNTCRQMEKIYQQLKRVVISQQTVSLKDKKNLDLYFGDTKSVTFKDLKRVQFTGTYYEALMKLLSDLQEEYKRMDAIDKSLGDKYERTKANSSLGTLNPGDQRLVIESLQQTVKVMNIISNVIKCVMSDMREIENGINTIMKRQDITPDKNAVNAAKKAAEDAKKPDKKSK